MKSEKTNVLEIFQDFSSSLFVMQIALIFSIVICAYFAYKLIKIVDLGINNLKKITKE